MRSMALSLTTCALLLAAGLGGAVDPAAAQAPGNRAGGLRAGAGRQTRRAQERIQAREADCRDHHGEGRRDRHRVLSRRCAEDGGQLRHAGQEGLLRRRRLPPARGELRHPGRRSQGQRHRRPRLHHPRGVQQAEARARRGGDGAHPGPRLRGQPVLHLRSRPPTSSTASTPSSASSPRAWTWWTRSRWATR